VPSAEAAKEARFGHHLDFASHDPAGFPFVKSRGGGSCAAIQRFSCSHVPFTIDVGVLVIWRRVLPRVVAVSTLSDVGGVAVVSMSAPFLICLESTNAQQSSLDIRPIFLPSEAAAELRSWYRSRCKRAGARANSVRLGRFLPCFRQFEQGQSLVRRTRYHPRCEQPL
jgi:hypothetical protein